MLHVDFNKCPCYCVKFNKRLCRRVKFSGLDSLKSFSHADSGAEKVVMPQCPKLRVHPAPVVQISTAGCTVLGGVHPVCARFLSHLLLLYIERVHGAISGCTVLWELHPASAQNKSLISDTVPVYQMRSEKCVNVRKTS